MNCGNPLADKWLYYQRRVQELRGGKANASSDLVYMDGKNVPDTPEARVLKELGLIRYCCRKHMLTHVDLMDKI